MDVKKPPTSGLQSIAHQDVITKKNTNVTVSLDVEDDETVIEMEKPLTARQEAISRKVIVEASDQEFKAHQEMLPHQNWKISKCLLIQKGPQHLASGNFDGMGYQIVVKQLSQG